jgi:hypothetical protein
MPRIVSTEASLYNGISQQNPELRLTSQVEDAENVSFTVPRGLEKRPPVETVSTYEGYFGIDSLVHPISYSRDEAYMFVVSGVGATKATTVIDMEGNEYLIRYISSSGVYLRTPAAGDNFRPSVDLNVTSVLDYTFVTNRNVTVSTQGPADAVLPNVGYLWVKNGVQQVERSIILDGNTLTRAKGANNDTEEVVDQFFTDVNALVGYTAEKISKAVLKIYKDDGTQFDLEATDTYGDTTMEVSLSWGSTLDTLPPVATDDEIMTIETEENADADYFLQFNSTSKEWFEVRAPNEIHDLDATTMPHALIKKIDDGAGTITGTPNQIYFDFEALPYTSRVSGGEDTSPKPSFVDSTINDVFFFKNRLGFLSADNVILSATDDIFRFWPTTVKEVLDDDPIDLSISSNDNVKLYHAVTFPDSLIIVGDKQQFSLNSGSKAFTVDNVVLNPTTTYPASEYVPPVAIGASMYFTVPQNTTTTVREYTVQPDTLITDAADITAHVPRLIDNNIKQIVAESNQEYLFLLDKERWSSAGNGIWVYKFYWQGNDKVQSAWHKWSFWFNPEGAMSFDGSLYIIGTESILNGAESRTYLGKIDLKDKPTIFYEDVDKPYKISRPYVDRVSLLTDAPEVCSGSIKITQEQYEDIANIDNATHVLVNRRSGEVFTIENVAQIGDDYVILYDCAESGGAPTPADPECLTIGTYTLGGGCTE